MRAPKLTASEQVYCSVESRGRALQKGSPVVDVVPVGLIWECLHNVRSTCRQ